MSDTTLNLGTFQFQDLEIPAQIGGLGGMQSLAVRKLVGGAREVHSMGQDFRPIEWSGLFFGAGAIDRMNALKALAIGGEPQTLLWHSFNYLVVIRDFSADEELSFKIPYRISCEVVSDNANPISTTVSATTDSAIEDDLGTAQTLSESIDDSELTSLMASLAAAIDAVATFASAIPSVVASVLQPLAAIQSYVTTLIGSNDIIIGDAAGFGGVAAGLDALTMALELDSVESAAFDEYELWQLGGVLGRMAANLNSINGSPNTLATVGGNLFQIAAAEYGDIENWTAIATANGLTDPFIQGSIVLTIPLTPSDSGGILSN